MLKFQRTQHHLYELWCPVFFSGAQTHDSSSLFDIGVLCPWKEAWVPGRGIDLVDCDRDMRDGFWWYHFWSFWVRFLGASTPFTWWQIDACSLTRFFVVAFSRYALGMGSVVSQSLYLTCVKAQLYVLVTSHTRYLFKLVCWYVLWYLQIRSETRNQNGHDDDSVFQQY